MSMYVIDIAIIIAALYLLFVGIRMKTTGKIPKAVMGEDLLKNCLDQQGFIDYIFPIMMVFSGVTLVASIIGFLLSYFNVLTWATYITSGVFIVVFIIFCVRYKKAMKKYFKDM